MTGAIDHHLAILLAKFAALRCGQQIEDCLGWTAELDAQRRDNDRPVDQNRVCHHRIEKLVVGDAGVVEL